MFCSHPTTNLQILKSLISRQTFKSLSKLEIDTMFDRELLLILNSERAFNEFVQVHRIMMMRELLVGEGVEEEAIDEIISNLGHVTQQDHVGLQNIHYCPRCEIPINNSRCTNCNILYCRSCFAPIIGVNHLCDSTAVESVKLIYKTCKPCPTCKTLIQKESGGCDQMFCTKCQTTFSWVTGDIVQPEDIRHNPHFYEWRRSLGFQDERNPDDDPCEGYFLMKNANNPQLLFIHSVIQRSILTMNEISERDDLIREAMRLNYIIKKISLSQWRKRFANHIKILRRNNALRNILRLCLQSIYHVSLSPLSGSTEQGSIEAESEHKILTNLFHYITDHIQIIQKDYLSIDEMSQYNISDDHILLPYGMI